MASGTSSYSSFVTKIQRQNDPPESRFLTRIYGFCLDANVVMESEVWGMWCSTLGLKEAARQLPSKTTLISGPSVGKGTKSHLISCEKQQNTDTPSGARALCSSPASESPPTLPLAFQLLHGGISTRAFPDSVLLEEQRGTFFNHHHSAPVSHSAASNPEARTALLWNRFFHHQQMPISSLALQ